ncbi:MlaD family protein [Paraconexibacter sp.]|uniref:MlaD family protein n=1 Tax=Paraconexibacter sp. TaxID=2949640 RepID=UPI003562F48D
MTVHKVALGGLVGLVVLLGLTLGGGCGRSADYTVRLEMDDALGLRNGSKVVVGGIDVGRVSLELGRGDTVEAEVTIDEEYAPIGKDATANIKSVNLLGQKSLELVPGDSARDPAPSGFTLKAARVTPSTDLDQVLDVLDSDTRDRLTILLNEAGQAVTGRRTDIASVLRSFPTGLQQGRDLLARVDADHGRLADLVRKSDRFVATVTRDREALTRMLDTFGGAAETAATRRSQLRATLRRLPGTLVTAQAFLDDLRTTSVPLGSASRQLREVAGPLDDTLSEVAGFTDDATPTLRLASKAAPSLTRLAVGATPVVQRLAPTLRRLAAFSSDLAPVTAMLDKSANNLIGTAVNWAHAIQGRDSLSHVFRAEVAISPHTLQQAVDYYLASIRPARTEKARKPARTKRPSVAVPKPTVPAPVKKATDPVTTATDRVTETLEQAVRDAIGGGDKGTESLLDFLFKP